MSRRNVQDGGSEPEPGTLSVLQMVHDYATIELYGSLVTDLTLANSEREDLVVRFRDRPQFAAVVGYRTAGKLVRLESPIIFLVDGDGRPAVDWGAEGAHRVWSLDRDMVALSLAPKVGSLYSLLQSYHNRIVAQSDNIYGVYAGSQLVYSNTSAQPEPAYAYGWNFNMLSGLNPRLTFQTGMVPECPPEHVHDVQVEKRISVQQKDDKGNYVERVACRMWSADWHYPPTPITPGPTVGGDPNPQYGPGDSGGTWFILATHKKTPPDPNVNDSYWGQAPNQGAWGYTPNAAIQQYEFDLVCAGYQVARVTIDFP